MKIPNLIQKARDLWNRKEDQRRTAAMGHAAHNDKEADPHRAEEARREQQRQDDRALEQFEKHASGYNPDLDGEWEEDLPVDMPSVPVATLQEATPAASAAELPQYGMEPLIPLTHDEIAKLKVIESEDPKGRSMHAQFDPRTVLAMREQAEAMQVLDPHETGGCEVQWQDPDPKDDLEPDDELDM